jgi:tetratricopeptide (TPR) repeat protein
MNRYPKSIRIVLMIVIALTVNIGLSQAQDRIDAGTDAPSHPALIHYRLGSYYQLQGDHERAIAEFSLTIEGMPGLGYAWAARGNNYMALGDYDQAISDYSQAIEIFPDYVSALYTRGRAYAAAGEPTLAMADYRNAIAQMPKYPYPYWGMGDLYYDLGQPELAMASYRLYLSVNETPDAFVVARYDQLQADAA